CFPATAVVQPIVLARRAPPHLTCSIIYRMSLTPSRATSPTDDGGTHQPASGLADTAGGAASPGETAASATAAAVDGMDPQLATIRPGGGGVMSVEWGWGYVRRRLLRLLRPGYVEQMRVLRQGIRGSLPFEPVDPRDLKFYRNQE